MFSGVLQRNAKQEGRPSNILGIASLTTMKDLIRSLPVRSAFGLPVDVAASPAAPFSTSLGMTKKEQK